MNLAEIRSIATNGHIDDYLQRGTPVIEQSFFRSFYILAKVRDLLEQGTPVSVVLELIDDMENSTAAQEPVAYHLRKPKSADEILTTIDKHFGTTTHLRKALADEEVVIPGDFSIFTDQKM